MKAVNNPQKSRAFQPVDITIRLESVEDAEKLYFMFNYTPLTDVLSISYPKLDAESIRKQIRKLVQCCDDTSYYDKYSSLLENKIKGIQ